MNTHERTLGQLVSSATQDLSAIIRGEIALAKIELTNTAKSAGKGGGMLAAAGVLAMFMFMMLLITLGWLITTLPGWSPWMGFGIVTLLLMLVVGILAMLGIKSLKKVKPKPELAMGEAQATVEAIKGANPHTGAAIAGVITREEADRRKAEKARDKARAEAEKAEEKSQDMHEKAEDKRVEAAENARRANAADPREVPTDAPQQSLTSGNEVALGKGDSTRGDSMQGHSTRPGSHREDG